MPSRSRAVRLTSRGQPVASDTRMPTGRVSNVEVSVVARRSAKAPVSERGCRMRFDETAEHDCARCSAARVVPRLDLELHPGGPAVLSVESAHDTRGALAGLCAFECAVDAQAVLRRDLVQQRRTAQRVDRLAERLGRGPIGKLDLAFHAHGEEHVGEIAQ